MFKAQTEINPIKMSSVLQNKYNSQESYYSVKVELHVGEKQEIRGWYRGSRHYTTHLEVSRQIFVAVNRNHKLFYKGKIWMEGLVHINKQQVVEKVPIMNQSHYLQYNSSSVKMRIWQVSEIIMSLIKNGALAQTLCVQVMCKFPATLLPHM